jgi:hypothetical protein
MKKIVKLTERDLTRLVNKVIKEQDYFNRGNTQSKKPMIDKKISESLLSLLQTSVSWVGREETSKLLEKVISKLMDYDNIDISSDYKLNFDWIQDVVGEMEDEMEILMRKNQEKKDFDLEQRGWTKNKY